MRRSLRCRLSPFRTVEVTLKSQHFPMLRPTRLVRQAGRRRPSSSQLTTTTSSGWCCSRIHRNRSVRGAVHHLSHAPGDGVRQRDTPARSAQRAGDEGGGSTGGRNTRRARNAGPVRSAGRAERRLATPNRESDRRSGRCSFNRVGYRRFRRRPRAKKRNAGRVGRGGEDDSMNARMFWSRVLRTWEASPSWWEPWTR